MTLAVLVGNTNTTLTWFRGDRVVRRACVPTARVLDDPGALRPGAPLDAVALASVVPRATVPARRALRAETGLNIFHLTAASRTGLARVDYDRRRLGADRLCAAVGARARHPGDLLVVDFGTAVTVDAVTARGEFLGGVILPGLATMAGSLHAATGRLPSVRPGRLGGVRCHDTRSAIGSGTLHLLLGGLERIVGRFEDETGLGFSVIATGGGSAGMKRLFPRIDVVDRDLAAAGLLRLLRLNRPGT